jgi:PAS domain S-box-containing protein
MPKKKQLTSSSRPPGEVSVSTEEHFRIISELTSDFAYADRVEPDGTIIPEWASDAVTRVTGYTVEEITSQGLKSIIHTDDWPLVREHIKKVLSGHSDVIECRIVTRSGDTRWLRDYAHPVWDKTEERVTLIYGASQDITERKLAEAQRNLMQEALRESEERFKLAAGVSSLTLFEQDLDLRYVWVYPQHPEFPEGNIGKSDEELMPSEDANMLTRLKRQVIETGEGSRQEVRATLPGEVRWYDITVEPRRNLVGEIVGVAGVALDVTGRKRAEEERTQVERDFMDFVENAAVGLHWVAADGTILWANQAELDLLGYSREEYIGRHISEFHADQEIIKDILHRLSNKQTLRDYEARLRHKDGSLRHVLITSNVRWDKGRFLHTRCFTLDITEAKRADEVRNILVSIVESSDDAILSKDMEGTIISWNKGAERLYGYTLEEVKGRPVYLLMPQEREDDFPKIMAALKRGERIEHYETERLHKDGRIIQVSLTVSPVRNAAGEIIGASAVARDITASKRLEREREDLLRREQTARREAEAASHMKDEFLAIVSHELRTPLNAILGWASILQMNLVDPDATAQAAETIERNARAQNQLIDDLLDISRIITGRMRLEVQSVDIPMIIQAAVNAIRPAADAKEIRLQVVLDPFAGTVSGDPNRIQQVVWNLLANAVKFTPKKGRIQVHLERIDSHVEITVSDTGRGISPQFLPYVFDRFRQADSSITRIHGGLGLGLSIVRQLVELHGGTVEAKSEGEAQGATFTVKLPITISKSVVRYTGQLSQIETPPAGELSHRLPSLANLSLLVVEDEADARELLITILKGCGAEVQAAASAAEGLKILKEWRPDVLISDIEMPYEDGLSFIGKVRALSNEEGGHIPAIAVTAHVRDEDRLQALSAGFDAHVGKPMEPLELVTVIANLARRMSTRNGEA